ncbi:hypothetical protein T440DRAFT_310425 [Plenodomus tracheiphilus IPT5]|uniref:Zn(2)-C6 fungal-type domain-containing protein n=1 Tax=Plenodomus tracheiphilus IPT5 TaxID=1408161 RepID=A0A6A7BDT8_9PLEO|nr:hypothetical protein T440DRAFT_310425 [Plenodomus tracheiphilus IPT5]
MEFETRRYLPASPVPFSDYYSPLPLAHSTRASPHGYPVGGPVGGIHGRLDETRDDHRIGMGSARRRIAVACARCRKRKIRCSGDPGNGAGCTSCVLANIDPILCQFHRVGSDHVHKVMNDMSVSNSLTQMASANGMVPIYSNSGSNPYSRSMATHQYSHIDTKSVYPSTWTLPYQDDTSPIESYQLDQSSMYLPDPTPMSNSSMYGSYRWNHPMQKQSHEAAGYMDQESIYQAHGLPYMQPSFRSNTAPDSISPLASMPAMQMNMPDKSHMRQSHAPGAVSAQRLLPIPQPSPAQASRASFDLEHDQRLRSVQAMGASAMDEKPSFAKLSLPWSKEEDVPTIVSEAASTAALQIITSSPVPVALEAELGYLPTSTSITNDGLAASMVPQMQLNFSTSGLFDPMSVTSPATTYSNFRECRTSNPSSTQMARQSSQNTYYSFGSERSSKRTSVSNGSSNDGTLSSGLRYQPLPHSPSRSSPGDKKQRREAMSKRHATVHRESINDMNSSF